VNYKNKKELKTLQEQHDEYLLDLDPKTTDEKIGHTSAPFASAEEITDTSDQLASQKSFMPDEAKQYSRIKQNDNLEGNKPIEGEEEKYSAKPNKEILNIGEARNKLRYGIKPLSGAQISKAIKDIKAALNNLSSKLAVDDSHKDSASDLDHLNGMLSTIEQKMLVNGELDTIDEEFKSKAQAKYFYSQANKPGKKGKKWSKMADEFSSKTDFSKLPTKKESKDNNLDNLLENLLKK